MMSASALLFDLDGTLVDSRIDLAAAINAARQGLGLDTLPLETITEHVGDGLGKLIERSFADAPGCDLVQARQLWNDFYADHCCEHTMPYEGVDETLRALAAAGWRMGVVTNKPRRFSLSIIAHLGWQELLPAVVGGDQLRKPDPAPLYQVLACLGAAPAGSWMIGDHRTDCDAGNAAGCRVAFCNWGIGRREGRKSDAELDRMTDLTTLLLHV